MDIGEALKEVMRLDLFVNVCLVGFHHGIEAKKWVEVNREIADVMNLPNPYPTEDALRKAEQDAERAESFARIESDNGYPYIYSLASIRLWSLLETAVDDLVVDSLKDPSVPKSEMMRDLKGPLLDFAQASPDHQAEYLADQLKLAVGARLKLGVGRFESILDPVGLAGDTDDDVPKIVFSRDELVPLAASAALSRSCRRSGPREAHRSPVIGSRRLAALPGIPTCGN